MITNDVWARVADVFGAPTSEVRRAYLSARRGEYEPLRAFGIDVSARRLADQSLDEIVQTDTARIHEP